MYSVLESRQYREWKELSADEKEFHKYYYDKSSLCRCLHRIGSEDVSLHFRYRLEELGMPTDDVRWSLSNCQGDGVAFYGNVPLTEKLLVHLMVPLGYHHGMTALRYLIAAGQYSVEYKLSPNSYGHHYTHGRCIMCDVNDVWGGDTSRLSGIGGTSQKIENAIYELEGLLLEYVREICGDLESEGYDLLDAVFEDEHLEDFCIANGILFDRDGKEHWNSEDMLDGVQVTPTLVVEIEGGVIVSAKSDFLCRIIVLDHDAETMDPQGFPEPGIIDVVVEPQAIIEAEGIIKKAEERGED